MAEIKVINEVPMTMVELKDKIDGIKKRDKELSYRANKIKDYLDQFVGLKKKDVDNLRKKINDLNIPRLRERHITKIIDVMPEDIDSVKILFTGENITIKQEDLQKILGVVKEFVK